MNDSEVGNIAGGKVSRKVSSNGGVNKKVLSI